MRTRKLQESWQVIGVTRLLSPYGAKKLTFFPAPVQEAPFIWGRIAVRCYYRKDDMGYGLIMSEDDARPFLQDAFIRYENDGHPECNVPMAVMPLEGDGKNSEPNPENGKPIPQVTMVINDFTKMRMEVVWDKRKRYSPKKWGQVGIAIFLIGLVHGHPKDKLIMLSETNVEAENLLKG